MQVRLNKAIAHAGIASRRAADGLIASGKVSVNGQVVRTLGMEVGENDLVEVDGKPLPRPGKKLYYAINKPEGFITTASDEKGRPTVMDLVGDIDGRVYPVGRLDAATKGLLFLTNDGDFAYALTHPGNGKKKTYKVRALGHMSDEKLRKLRKGVEIDGRMTAPSEAVLKRQARDACTVELVIGEGRNRQIRKMFESIDMKVVELERIAVEDIRLGALKPGHYRKLRREEVDSLING
ncbi:MAG: rRNA pseudouridine synthase [Clostridiales Family XIII bacterium]|jgi:23S rRNA pseudouridine2605 synthase|nr:rRNA pseudouridine synthase [Clostridiales Family XIII bacterium]